MMRQLKTCFLIVVLPCIAGCTTVSQSRSAGVKQRSDLETVKADLHRLREQVDGMATAQEDLSREIDALRVRIRENDADVGRRLGAVEQSTRGAGAARESLRRGIVDELSKKIADIMRTRDSRSGSPVATGVEHPVEKGQTLSEIAAAYKVSVDAIVKANNLKNPNAIRVGQKLFIPE
jgi:LysM repeat protein